MTFNKTNTITGWIVFAIASIVYIVTREATSSLWDTGEFIASAYKLQLPHPPGAPLFVLLGRVFIVFFGGDNPANAVNLMSALASSFSILFLFWTITHFARKMFVVSGDSLTSLQTAVVMGAGVVGGLAYTFSDSFWFSAVEGEVYALSSFFTALVFWAMTKWERANDAAATDVGTQNRADRWIVFIFFMMGLSIGVHLLNLLTIPAIVMIYYFSRYKPTRRGSIYAFLIGVVLTGIIQVAVIKYSVKIAGWFDIQFVNGFGLPFFSGFIFFFLLIGVLVFYGLRYARRKGASMLRLGIWCFIFMMIGYSTYVTTLVRSNANPSIDMNNVDNPMSLVYYLGREQYGEQPLLYGPHFSADYVDENGDGYWDVKKGSMKYVKGKQNGKDRYIPIGRDQEPVYDKEDMQLFPRVWDPSNDQQHADFYAQWLNLGRETNPMTGQEKYEAPTYSDNMRWFFTYQMGLMYWRYFMWNFSGKQNDIQGFGNKRDGNWITGYSFIDNTMLGDQSMLPDSIQNNKANNKLFLIPFILGMIGCIYHFLARKRDWIVLFLLFFSTGLAIVFYLNQPGNQPRERDYAYVGSFYAFAMWIGLAVPSIVQIVRDVRSKETFLSVLGIGSVLVFLISLMSLSYGVLSAAFIASILITAIFAAVTALIYYAVRAISSNGNNFRTAVIASIAIGMIAPVIMGMQEWDDHNRGRKTIARDVAINYLESCAPNAILFTFGDNDTYPLWYAQEVENVRPDIRIVNNSLLGIDWYVNQLRYKVNESAPIDVIWTPEQIEGHNREYMRFQAQGSQTQYYDLFDAMKNALGRDVIDPETQRNTGPQTFPVKRFKLTIDSAAVRKWNVLTPSDTLLQAIQFEIPQNKNVLLRNELIILNIIAANNWQRPIYFTAPYGELGFGHYLRKDGMAYRLVPAQQKFPQQNWIVEMAFRQVGLGSTAIRDNHPDSMFSTLFNKFRFGGANLPGMYYDDENRRAMNAIRSTFAEAAGNLADANKRDEANKLLNHLEANISPANLPYAMVGRFNQHNQSAMIYLEAAYKAGNMQLAEKIRAALKRDLDQQKAYYSYLQGEKPEMFESLTIENEINNALLQVLESVVSRYAPQSGTKPVEGQNTPVINNPADSGRRDSPRQ